MAKGGKAAPGILRGVSAALVLYLGGTALLALLVVRDTIPEGTAFPVLAVLCVLSALCGGLLVGLAMPPMPGALAAAACFAGVLLAVGATCWQGIAWMGHGGILLACALAGGVLAGLLSGSRRGRRRKGRRK